MQRDLDGSSEPLECELCAGPLEREHRHVLEIETRRMECTCAPCALLFEEARGRRYRAIPQRVRREEPFAAAEAWRALGLGDVGFCFLTSAEHRWTAAVPGPAGAVEVDLDAAAWHRVWSDSPLARSLEPDVEALLVYAHASRAPQAFSVPIDRCYALTESLQGVWSGDDGGAEVSAAIDAFFEHLARANASPGAHDAWGGPR